MTPLRQRFLDDLRLRNYSPRTIQAYVAGVARLANHFGRAPDQLGPEDLRTFQLHLIAAGVSWSLFNQSVCAWKLFYGQTLGRPEVVPFVRFAKRPKRLPVVLAPDEVLQLFAAARPGVERVLLQTDYALGLRVSELIRLRVPDLDSRRMVVHVHAGKGRKDRRVPLSPKLLAELRAYWRVDRPACSRLNFVTNKLAEYETRVGAGGLRCPRCGRADLEVGPVDRITGNFGKSVQVANRQVQQGVTDPR